MATSISIIISSSAARAMAGFSALNAGFRRLVANARVAASRMTSAFIARGGIPGVLGPHLARLGGMFSRAGSSAASFFVNNFKSIAMAGMSAAAAPIVATLVSGIAAALAAGVLLAVGGGVLVAGIKAAANDPAVAGAWKTFGDRAKAAFANFGEPFKAPLIRAADTFGGALERMAPAIKQMGETMAPVIDKLAPAFATMAEKAMPGIQKAVEASVPLFEKLAEHAPEIGEAISDFFTLVADSGPEAVKVFDFLLDALEETIRILGGTINFAAKFYSTMLDFWSSVGRVIGDALSAIGGFFTGLWENVRSVFGMLVDAVLGFFGTIINGAANAFGWVPGIGEKLKGAAAAFNKFRDDANNALNGIKKTVDITVNYRARMIGNHLVSGAQQSGTYSSGIGGRASGGIASGLTWVGENGPELADFSQGRVHSSAKSAAMARSAGGGNATVVIAPGDNSDSKLAGALLKVLRVVIRNDYGGDVQAALGRA